MKFPNNYYWLHHDPAAVLSEPRLAAALEIPEAENCLIRSRPTISATDSSVGEQQEDGIEKLRGEHV